MIDIKLDVHTHTIVSGHAFSTLNEMIQEAEKHHLTLFGVTEHGPAIPGTCHPIYFRNLHVVPRQYGKMHLLLGAELNIIDYDGNVDITDPYILSFMDHVIAGLHSLCYTDGNRQQNTSALLGALENPHVHIISHPCDGTASQPATDSGRLRHRSCCLSCQTHEHPVRAEQQFAQSRTPQNLSTPDVHPDAASLQATRCAHHSGQRCPPHLCHL